MQPDSSLVADPGQISAYINALTDTPQGKPVRVIRIVEIIRSSEKAKQQMEMYRAIASEHDAKQFADRSFLCTTWSMAATTGPNIPAIHSRLISAHIVGLSTERLAVLWAQLQADEYTHVLFTDQWNTGLIVVVRIDYQKPGDHQAFAKQLSDYYYDIYKILTIENILEGVKPELEPASLAPDYLCPVTNCVLAPY